MVNLHASNSPLIRLFSALLLLIAAAAVAEPLAQGTIVLNSDTNEVDFRTGKTVFRNVAISQDGLAVSAERAEATGLDLVDSRWEFSGNVVVSAPERGKMYSERAVVEFRDNRITRATIKGSPARFEQTTAATTRQAQGRAGEIIYDIGSGKVQFANNAWLSNGQYQISGPLLVYDVEQQKVLSTRENNARERVQITIAPKATTPESSTPP
jgi:lipopolysaccharide transport protein LptA